MNGSSDHLLTTSACHPTSDVAAVGRESPKLTRSRHLLLRPSIPYLSKNTATTDHAGQTDNLTCTREISGQSRPSLEFAPYESAELNGDRNDNDDGTERANPLPKSRHSDRQREAMRQLLADENFVTLLRAEGLVTMPRPLADLVAARDAR